MIRWAHQLLLAAVVAALVVGCSPKLQTDVSRMPVDEEGRQPLRIGRVVKKRQIAPVMSVAHADWLTRPDRDAEEQPDRVVRELRIQPGSTVADLGAGVGYFTWRLAGAVGDAGKVIAVDIQPGMLERLKQNLAERDIHNVEMVLGSEDDPHLPPGQVDLVLLVDVYHELQQPELTMEHVRQSLKPDGTWMIVEPFANDRVEDNLNPVGRIFYSASTCICTPASRSQEVGLCLGAQAGEARLRDVVKKGGFAHFRRAAQTPFTLVFEARAG
jgi:SAM-dependent methyltransferase